jgi:eukaryotic-like serine/threonine-protein kinase
MASHDYSSDRPSLTADEWRRICDVLDRVLDSRPSDQKSALEDACRIEGVAIADAMRYLAAARDDAAFVSLDPALVGAALAPSDARPSLTAGTCLGQYEVLGPIGAGGMAEVYRARDTTLHREVALKVLPPRFAIDTDRLMRFKREAHMLASLNHPNIAAIYGFEEFASTAHQGEVVVALALELVEGPTLGERLADGRCHVQQHCQSPIRSSIHWTLHTSPPSCTAI